MKRKKVSQTEKDSFRFYFPVEEAKIKWLSALLDSYAIVDRGTAVAIRREKRRNNRRSACSAGCDVCCRANTDIPVYQHELVGIYWYSIEKIMQPVRDVLMRQLFEHDLKPPCPFLISNICSIYPVRPTACRQYIVFGQSCRENEDPFFTRRDDVLTPIREFTDSAFSVMLTFYGFNNTEEGSSQVIENIIKTQARNLQDYNWRMLANRMKGDRL